MKYKLWLKCVLLLWLMPWAVQATTIESYNINSDFKSSDINICDILSLPLQGIKNDSVITISNNVNIKGLNNNMLGFSKAEFNSGSGNPTDNDYCNGNRCVINPDKQVNKIKLPVFDVTGGGVISSWNDKYKKILPGKYTSMDIGLSSVIFSSGDYFIDKISVHSKSEIIIEGNVRLFIKRMNIGDSDINMSGKSSDFQVFIYNSNYMAIVSNNAKIKAYIYSESEQQLQLTNTVEFYGSIIASKLEFNSTVNYFGENSCEIETKPIDFELLPNDTIFLTCDMVPIVINVLDDKGNVDINHNGKVTLRTNVIQSDIAFWIDNGNKIDVEKEIKIKIKNGQGRVFLKANVIADVKVFAQINDVVKSKLYKFVPYKFHAEAQRIIAGKPENVELSVLSCNNNLVNVEKSYSGIRYLKFKTKYITPSTKGNGVINVNNNNKNIEFENGKTSLNIMYPDSGVVNLIITDPNCTNDSCIITKTKNRKITNNTELTGSVSISSRPWTFAMCPQVGDSFTGTATSGDGLVAAGEAFVVRAKPLQWQAGDSLNNPIDVTNKTYCQRPITPNFFANGAPITTLTASIAGIDTPANGHRGELSGTVAQPNSGSHDKVAMIFNNLRWSEVGSVALKMTANSYLGMTINPSQRAIGRFYPKQLVITDSVITNAHTESSPFTYMDQAFTANVTVEAQNVIGEPTFNYGEFAPQLKETLLLTAVDLNPQTSINDLSSRLDQANLANGWQQQWQQAQLTITNGALTFKRLPKNGIYSTVKMTTADGPFEVGLGLSVLPRLQCSTLGCTDFIAKTLPLRGYNISQVASIAPLTGQVSSRYGRMVLQDVNGVFDKPLTMPLKVQYWNGEQFIINSDDSRSRFNSQWSCKQIIYTSKPHDKASLVATNNSVSQGQNNSLQVLPGIGENEAYIKQQLRFWLRIAAQPASNIGCTEDKMANQPWLTFNWRGVGDEDPSGLVTFGSYRGNDRIIYRAEKGLNQPIE
ncbi:hypothetical protein C0W42_12155 [Photobacterium kishitanii]|uniref:DUF6701 domain-containing protein n=1 Tax=Photobacterium kishitanii TaxID=318456 RepID=UPI000D16B66D|nr:DUF6701 domain-containing protein [Photobacterium kishitanii]PSU88643.1 hypothetical protein C0W42_12155 [Photobacterium kishitanii]